MELEIRLFSGLKCNNTEIPCYGQEEFPLQVPEGITIEELQNLLQLENPYPLITIINGLSKPKDWVLSDKDRVGIFLPYGGG